jgi:hypothetical protein
MSKDYDSQKTFKDLLTDYMYKTTGETPKETGLTYILTNIGKEKPKPRHDSLYDFLKVYLDNKDI